MPQFRVTYADLLKGISLPTGARHRIVVVGKGWVGLEMVDQDGAPVSGVAYEVRQEPAGLWSGMLSAEGAARIDGLRGGPCTVSFPELDSVEWMPMAVASTNGHVHFVEEGEHLAAIAAESGFRSFATIWEHSRNASLRAKRDSPHVLEPGDEIFVPELTNSGAIVESRRSHRFVLRGERLELRLKLLSGNGAPLTGAKGTVTVEGVDADLVSDADGLLARSIPPRTRTASLTTDAGQYELIVGGLGPIDAPAGVRSRLRNLGYLGDNDSDDEDQLRLAIELFQADQGLPLTGAADEQTKDAIQRVADPSTGDGHVPA